MPKRSRVPRGVLFLLLGSLAACGGGGGGASAGTTSFQLLGSSLRDGAIWELNREIVLTFSAEVDFSTVSANTIHLRSSDDVPVTGVFKLRDARTVVFQPTCPTRDDFSDAGLQPGGVVYTLRLPGRDTSANVLRSLDGVPLGIGQARTFSTPASTVASVAFQDTVQGPPEPLVRAVGSEGASTYLEIGGDPRNRVYFERDELGALVLSRAGFEVPLNLYSDPDTRVAVVIEFNQSVNPASTNISASRLRLEFLDTASAWQPIDTRVILVENCTETGARVRLEPIGILPPASAFRAVVLGGFQDLVGEANLTTQAAFALAPTLAVNFSSLTPADELSDAFADGFDFGGESTFSFEDRNALFDSPLAEWGGGELSAAFSFDGGGGPNGDFDWVVRAGEIFFFDTVSQKIVGGPGGIPAFEQTALGGVVDVRNLHIQEGGEIRVQGPNPMRILATGDVRIDGTLDLGGFNAKDVATLNTGNQVEIGGAGAAGGGKGGSASEVVTSSTPRGGRGDGPFRRGRLGGDGGETGFSPEASKDARRPGGGGGGRFAKDYTGTVQPNVCSVAALKGNDGHPSSTGAVTGLRPARGGEPGTGPFLDASDENDFFGTKPVVSGGTLVGLIRGELDGVWAGYGGGGGGNADPAARFPTPNWNFGSDEKGGGGGGAAGGLHIKALGRIVFGLEGEIVANGGRGATGENTAFLDHIGGTGGGGSGGHILLESASQVDFSDNGTITTGTSFEFVQACGPPTKVGNTDTVDLCCRTYSNGGAGGPGVIQLHVPDNVSPPSDSPSADIRIPTSLVGASGGLDLVTSPPPHVMIPTFGARSKARSRWISIGGADQNPGGSENLVRFLFDGIETAPGEDEGKVRVTGTTVDSLAPLTADPDLAAPGGASLLAGGFSLELEGAALAALRTGTTAGLSNDLYLRTPALLEGFAARLRVEQTPANFEDFPIVDARYEEGAADPGDERLLLIVTSARGPLTAFNADGALGTTGFQLVPRFFLVRTDGLDHALPDTAFVRLKFQAAGANVLGAPDEQDPLVDWTADIARFNALPPGALKFFRFEVEFDLDSQAAGVSENTLPVKLDFLKIPFVF